MVPRTVNFVLVFKTNLRDWVTRYVDKKTLQTWTDLGIKTGRGRFSKFVKAPPIGKK